MIFSGRPPRVVVLLLSVVLFAGVASAGRDVALRMPAVAGAYYPADPQTLLKTVQGFVEKAGASDYPAAMVACIASPCPYGLAGEVTANAFKHLKPGQYDRVIILSPSHLSRVENCSIPAVEAFVTPLGPVALDATAIRKLLFSTLFTARSLQYKKAAQREQVHEYEWGIEALLPYLQERLLEFQLVPIVVGELNDASGNYNPKTAEVIAEKIKEIVTPRTLIVVSSSFTHFGNDFSNRPFSDNIVKNIEHLDRQAFEPILALNAKGFEAYLKASKNVIDGKRCIEIMLNIVPRNTVARILAYEVSAEKNNDLNRSISFAAFTFHVPGRPAPEARPDQVRPLPMLSLPSAPAPPAAAPGDAVKAPAAAESAPAAPAAPTGQKSATPKSLKSKKAVSKEKQP